VTFQERNAADREFSDRYDLAVAIECIHDMSRPVEALRAMRSMVGEGAWPSWWTSGWGRASQRRATRSSG